MIMTGWIESVAKKARVKQPCDTHARRDVHGLKMSGAHARTSCNENSWRGCRLVHRGDEAGREGGWEGGREGGRDVLCLSPWLPDPRCTFGDFPKGGRHNLPAPRAAFLLPDRLLSSSSPLCSSRMHPFLHAFCCHIRVWGGGHDCECALARECLCAWNKLGVDHSAQRREGNESAESSEK